MLSSIVGSARVFRGSSPSGLGILSRTLELFDPAMLIFKALASMGVKLTQEL
jgi:hypothetical protein